MHLDIDEYYGTFLERLSTDDIQHELELTLTEHKELSQRLSIVGRRRDLYTNELVRRRGHE